MFKAVGLPSELTFLKSNWMAIFTELEQTIQKCIRNHRRPWPTKQRWERRRVGGITLPDVKLPQGCTHTGWRWHKSKHQSLGQNGAPGKKPTPGWAINIWRRGESLRWSKGVYSVSALGKQQTRKKPMKLDDLLPHTRKNKLKMD